MNLFCRTRLDRFAESFALLVLIFSITIGLLIAFTLFFRASPILMRGDVWQLLTGSTWSPANQQFGFLPFIVGTLWVIIIALIIAVPICLLVAIYLSEYASSTLRKLMFPVIDLLSGIPSVVYGLWGILVVVPFIRDRLAPFFEQSTSGYCVLSASIVLAIMVAPFMIGIWLEVFQTVPRDQKEASLALGATKWEMVKHVLLRKCQKGLLAGAIMGAARAIGETMAVMMLAGNIPILPRSVFDPSYPMPALIANNYGEMLSVPDYESALMLASVLLLVMILLLNCLSRIFFIGSIRKNAF